MPPRKAVACFALLALFASGALGADISILDTNAPGTGLNDQTVVAPVGLNFGTTRGQQALIALQYAATIWGATLSSPVSIVIDSAFLTPAQEARLACTPTSGILGVTSMGTIISGDELPVPTASYPVALANALTGKEMTPGKAHIVTRINAGLGTPSCLTDQSFYFGLDGKAGRSQHDLVSVLLHEFTHGLGFLSFVNVTNGSFGQYLPSIFDFHVWDLTDRAPWQSESAVERQLLVETADDLAFEGPALAAAVPDVLRFIPKLSVDVPTVESPVPFTQAVFSGPFFQGEAPVVVATPLDGCSDFTDASDIAGHLVLIQRSTADAGSFCRFWDKANRAQDAGALGVLFFNSLPDAPLVVPSGSPVLSIPVGFVSLETGTAIAQQAAMAPVTATFSQSALRGGVDDSGVRVLLYTPIAVAASSVSHFDTSATPALLMEPSVENTVGHGLDLTPAVLSDLGWTVVKGLSVVVAKALEQQVYPNQDASYLVTLVNRRPAAATDVTLALTVPGTVSVVSSDGACPSGTFPCTLGTVPPGAVLPTVVTLHVPRGVPNPLVVTVTASSSNASTDDVLTSTSKLPTVTSTGCSAGGGPGGLLAPVLLALFFLCRRTRRGSAR